MSSFGMLCRVGLVKTVFLRSVRGLLVTTNVLGSPTLVTLMMEAICFSETSVLTRVIRHNVPEYGILNNWG
jgi:hypothetical protein